MEKGRAAAYSEGVDNVGVCGMAEDKKCSNTLIIKALFSLLSLFIALGGSSSVKANVEMNIGLLRQPSTVTTAVPDYLRAADNDGEAGALRAIGDANGTGKFLGQKYTLNSQTSDDINTLITTATSWYKSGTRFFLADLSTAELTALRNALPQNSIVLNYGNADDALRTSLCLPNTLHTGVSYAMRADAIGQWLRLRRLNTVFLVAGPNAADQAYLAAVKASLKKFNHRVVDEKVWDFDTDLRRSASQELPLFTQAKNYDVVWAVDESNLFGQHLPFNTWLPRPVIGSHGMRSDGWHYAIEQWGAIQLQNRFKKDFERPMTAKDFAAWVAVRTLNEAVTALNTAEVKEVQHFILSDRFQLAAYKGRKLTYRAWNGQLRQPVPLFYSQALVATAPFEGFLHPHNELDTLGVDQAQSQCRLYPAL
ncbi:ABC transporter substrate-binding protein [Enterovibrio baiacu]|uniref:ABC transporter substrate-binding protein n=1 Tax=Enterovibrio baiacu TaxID=2491023 RepID=UPI003D0A72CA